VKWNECLNDEMSKPYLRTYDSSMYHCFYTFISKYLTQRKIQTILHTEKPTRCSSVSEFIILCSYEAQHVSGDTSPIIRSSKLH